VTIYDIVLVFPEVKLTPLEQLVIYEKWALGLGNLLYETILNDPEFRKIML
jgi:hypothetical protein